MWYGLEENGEIVAVMKCDHFPTLSCFIYKRKRGAIYEVYALRLRKISKVE